VFLLADGRRVDLTQGWGPARRDLAAGAPKLVPIVAKEPAPGATPAKATANDLAVKPVNASGGTSVAVKSAALVTGDTNPAQPNLKAPSNEETSTPQAKFLRQVHGVRAACSPPCLGRRPTTSTAPIFISTRKTGIRSTSASNGRKAGQAGGFT